MTTAGVVLAWVAACAVACGASQPEPGAPPPAPPQDLAIAAPTATTPPDDSSQDAGAVVQPETPPATDDVATSPPPPPPPIQANASLQAIAGATCPSSPGAGAPSGLSTGARPFWASSHRSLALLVTEIQQLEQLFQLTKPGAPDRPPIERRLAMDYYELEAAAYRDCVAVSSAQPASAGDAAQRAAVVLARGKTIAAAREMAIKDCTLLRHDFPAFAQTHACPVR